MKRIRGMLALVVCLCLLTAVASVSALAETNTKIVTDMRGVEVEIPADPQRVAIIDKGFLVQSMTALGVNDRIVASGDLIQTAESVNDRDSLFLCPQLLELPQIGYPTAAVDYETLVSANPDMVILRNSEYMPAKYSILDRSGRMAYLIDCLPRCSHS